MSRRVLLVIGTRPEAIKMAPVVQACRADSRIAPIICFTGQHREMLRQVTDYFGIDADVDLDLMAPDQTLAGLTSRCLEKLDRAIIELRPDLVIAQGDTTTVMAASLAAFYREREFVHVEAGLRSGNLHAPWPEELNRRITGLTTSLHCAPTTRAQANLLAEGVPPERIEVTGNTVVDALLWTLSRETGEASPWPAKYPWLTGRMVLITGHRRENLGGGLEQICAAIRRLAGEFPDVHFVYPVHLNPRVRDTVHATLTGIGNVHLTAPAAYPEFVWLMARSTLIISDSGGVQEEAPSLRRPVLVTRDTTERPEGVEAGAVELVGTDANRIVAATRQLLTEPDEYARRQVTENPYGDGRAAGRIVELIARGA